MIWKPIPGFSRYEASEQGEIRNARTERLINGWDDQGYWRVKVTPDSGKALATGAHRLVAIAFHPNPEGKPFVNHINLNRADNRPANLEWASPVENNRHSAKLFQYKKLLTADLVRKIREMRKAGLTLQSIADDLAITRSSVQAVTSGRSWTHLP